MEEGRRLCRQGRCRRWPSACQLPPAAAAPMTGGRASQAHDLFDNASSKLRYEAYSRLQAAAVAFGEVGAPRGPGEPGALLSGSVLLPAAACLPAAAPALSACPRCPPRRRR